MSEHILHRISEEVRRGMIGYSFALIERFSWNPQLASFSSVTENAHTELRVY